MGIYSKEKPYLVNEYILLNAVAFMLIFGSGIIYVYRVYKSDIEPSLASWSLLTMISLLVLLSYGSSDGTENNLLIVLFDFAEPVIVTVLISRKINGKKASKWEKAFIGITLVLLLLWAIVNYLVRDPKMLNLVLYLAVLAEVAALGPQFLKHLYFGEKDRPIPWIMSGLGYCLGIILLPEVTLPNLTIPFLGIVYLAMSLPLVTYRLKHKIPLRKWI